MPHPLVMVCESQTQTISLIRQAQRGTQISLARNSGSVADILANKKAGKVSMIVGWQDCVALEEENGNDWRNSRPPHTKLREYYELGLRTVNLTYQLSNQFGGGTLDPEARLTSQGKYLIAKMQDMGILCDVCGHTGDQTALDVIAMARRPVVITHGCCRGLNDNPRNSPDKVIEGVARTGGVMGVAAIDAFMTWGYKDIDRVDTGPFPPTANVARYVDEFDYLKRLVGIDHIALGTDFISNLQPADPTKLFEIPLAMSYNQPTTPQVHRGFRKRFRHRQRPRRNGEARLLGRRDRENLRRQLDARLSRGVEFVRLHWPLDRDLRLEPRTNLIACASVMRPVSR